MALTNIESMGRSHGLVVMGDDSCQEAVGSNLCTIYWMDMIFFTFICCKIVCLKSPKINKKAAGVGPCFTWHSVPTSVLKCSKA